MARSTAGAVASATVPASASGGGNARSRDASTRDVATVVAVAAMAVAAMAVAAVAVVAAAAGVPGGRAGVIPCGGFVSFLQEFPRLHGGQSTEELS